MSTKDKIFKSSYSDLFEDFFRSDAQDSLSTAGSGNQNPFGGVQSDYGLIQGNFGMPPSDSNELFLQYQQQQLQYQQQQQQQQKFAAYFNTLNPAQQMAFQYPVMPITVSSSIVKPGFVRNRTRKNMRQKSVANAVKANHLMNSANGLGMLSFPMIQQSQGLGINQVQIQGQVQAQGQGYQPATPQIPFYQQAAQIPMYQSQGHVNGQGQVNINHQQNPPAVLISKSPIAQIVQSISPAVSHPQSPSSSRSPTSNSSDYVKMRLQQKIRSRMVSKGQIPPNPTDEELRMCGIQIPSIPTPNPSPHHHQQHFSNNNSAPNSRKESTGKYPVAVGVGVVASQQNDEIMKYFDINDVNYSQRDPLLQIGMDSINSNNNYNNYTTNQPLSMNSNFNNYKQQQQQQNFDSIYPPTQQFQHYQSDMMNDSSTATSSTASNYDQFFSDFILF